MNKRTWSLFFLSAALVTSSYAATRVEAAQTGGFLGDPVPGGMCGCMSCNCYFPEGLASTTNERVLSRINEIDPRTLTASLESIHDAREDAVIKAQTSASKPATGSTGSKTTGGTSASKPTGATAPAKSTVANPNKTTTTVKNSSGSPDDRDESSSNSGRNNSNNQKSAPKNSSGSPDERSESKSSATGKSSGSYPYDSDTGKSKTGTGLRSGSIYDIKDTKDWGAPKIEDAAYTPSKEKTDAPIKGMGDNVKTTTSTDDPWKKFYSGFYKKDETTGQNMVNVAPGPNLYKQPEPKKESYYGPYYDKDNTKYWLDSKGKRTTEEQMKKKSN